MCVALCLINQCIMIICLRRSTSKSCFAITAVLCTMVIFVKTRYGNSDVANDYSFVIYSASIAGEETLHTYLYIHSYIKATQ